MNRAREFFTDYAMPFVEEWRRDHPSSLRHAFAAAVFLSHVADWEAKESGRGLGDVVDELCAACDDFALLRDVANAAKHLKVDRPRASESLTSAGAAIVYSDARPIFVADGWPTSAFPPRIVIELTNGTKRDLHPIVDAVVAMWEQRFGITSPDPSSVR